MSAVKVLTAGGILRPAEVVELADRAGLELAAGAVCLLKESSGGRNVWGSDPVSTGGAYVKGGEVTRIAYERYRDLVRAGRIQRQGVGPTQLTYGPLQDEADAAGGCWEWRANVLVGFRHLAALQKRYGVGEGFRRYNGSGPMAERYRADAEARLAVWRARLAPPAPALEDLVYGMRDHPEVRRLQGFLRDTFPAYAGDLPATGNYLDQTVAAVRAFQERARVTNADGSAPDGRTVSTRTRAALARHGY